jgi:serine protease Do
VFAVGNPLGLGWTHTTGTVSQFRVLDHGTHKLRVIQTQTAVNPGNSGGGLYAADGTLIGIVTLKQDERTGAGLNFAISVDELQGLLPPDFLPDSNSR